MTPEDLIERTRRVQVLQNKLLIINRPNAYVVIPLDTTQAFIRTSDSSQIHLPPHLQEFAKFIAETVRTKMILEIEQKIKQLCNLQPEET